MDAAAPLTIHVVGAAYPFEGRSDWGLLASHRPKSISGVRVVLVLGTPWQVDNVAFMDNEEADPFAFLQTGQIRNQRRHPSKATWDDKNDRLMCNNSEMLELDREFRKEDYCRDHGDGLEVVCVEKYYQEVYDDLPSPDAVVMFSPGFPQLGRRSWDAPLRRLLDDNVLLMVADLLKSDTSWGEMFQSSGHEATMPGHAWPVQRRSMEDGMTLIALDAYGTRRLGSWRNPFPLRVKQRHRKVAKNAVLQAFRGRRDGHSSLDEMPSAALVEDDAVLVRGADWTEIFEGEVEIGREFRDSMLTPVSFAYERAMRELYEGDLRKLVLERGLASFSPKQRATIERMGLAGVAGRKRRDRPRWSAREWLFCLTELEASDLF